MVGLLRCIRLDPSDTILFDPPARPGEWAVPGGFLFHGTASAALGRKQRVAFRSGFLGVESFGFSTLVEVAEADSADLSQARAQLAQSFLARLGAPDLAAAEAAAEEELAFAEDLCRGHAPGQLIALHRAEDAQGQITERFRALRPRGESAWAAPDLRGHERPFHFVETAEAEADTDPMPDLDLFAPIRAASKGGDHGQG